MTCTTSTRAPSCSLARAHTLLLAFLTRCLIGLPFYASLQTTARWILLQPSVVTHHPQNKVLSLVQHSRPFPLWPHTSVPESPHDPHFSCLPLPQAERVLSWFSPELHSFLTRCLSSSCSLTWKSLPLIFSCLNLLSSRSNSNIPSSIKQSLIHSVKNNLLTPLHPLTSPVPP